MINFQKVRTDIMTYIRKNGRKLITGEVLKERLLRMVDLTEDVFDDLKAKDDLISEDLLTIHDKDIKQDSDIAALSDNVRSANDGLTSVGLRVEGIEADVTGLKNQSSTHDKSITKNTNGVEKNTQSIATLQQNIETLTGQVDELDRNKQKKDLWVEIRNVGGGRLIASDTANDIKRYIDSGGDVLINFNEEIYRYDRYEQGTSYFRFLDIKNGVMTNNRIEVHYNKEAFYTSYSSKIPENVADTLDVTELYTAMRNKTKVSESFVSKVQEGVEKDKFMYISDKEDAGVNVFLIVICIKKVQDEMTFSAFDGRTSFILLLNTSAGNRTVSLDTERIGAEFSIFNNTDGKSIFLLTQQSSNQEIQECLTDAKGEIKLPETGDVFNVHENSDLRDSGLVISRTEDSGGLYMTILCNDLVKAHFLSHYIHFGYEPSRGFDSLTVENVESHIVDITKLDSTYLSTLEGKVARLENEINDFNISAINGQLYNLQGAISALSSYLGDRKKFTGMKVTFAESAGMPQTYIYKQGSFVSTSSWSKL